MNSKNQLFLSTASVAVISATLFLWLWLKKRPPAEELNQPAMIQESPRGRHLTLQVANPEPESADASPVVLTLAAQQASEKVLELTRAAKFYKYDPTILAYQEQTNRNGHYVVFSTPSHAAQVLNGKVLKMMSFHDNSNADARDPDAAKSWYQCTGTWSEEEAVNETLELLKRLQDTNTLNAVAAGRREFKAVPISVTTPGGEKVRVSPFPTVRLYDADNILRVKAEYRAGATGVVGLTDWFNNR